MPIYTKGTAFSGYSEKRTNLFPGVEDVSYSLRVLVCKAQQEGVPSVDAPTLSLTFLPEPGTETLLLAEPWEDIP